ncbi:hypothetical protein BACFIN_08194 [Bacteroides finegoldii DSM 17565]|nr:hypothetical protein BACFIN_08194 [Bacteroides finegoldii DSM 17565]
MKMEMKKNAKQEVCLLIQPIRKNRNMNDEIKFISNHQIT